ncbi:hypothetical protein BHE74_00047737 [Ensete ventricosum]|nr:hypothetical protein BHE74_00047737 [Ensete ventricosum]
MITLYAEGSSTTMKEPMRVLVFGSSLKVIGRVTMTTEAIASPVNPIKVEVMRVIALLGVMTVVAVEATVAPTIAFLSSSPHRVGGFEESFLPEPGNGLLYSFRPLPWELGWWAPRGFGPRSLLVFVVLYHQGLGGDILVGPL